jgi:hypothetical protein
MLVHVADGSLQLVLLHYPPNAQGNWRDGRLTGWRRVSGVYGRSC